MKTITRHGVLVIGHGSRRSEANHDVRRAARLIGEQGRFPLVEVAFLEIERPDIRSGFDRLVQLGANSITVHPYFLSPGRHTRGDLPVKVAEASAEHPHVKYRITEPLSAHRLVVAASVERIRDSISRNFGGSSTAFQPDRGRVAEKGKVYLVGAGPGDPGLLTLRARDLLESCDVVFFDHLVNPEILTAVSPVSELFYVGKIGGAKQTPQSRINRLLLDSARLGKSVVRLKGGDPFIYGRGGEEALFLSEAGIGFEIVPGISSAFSAAAYAGIPLTHRGVSASVAVATGTREHGGELDAAADTLVILMGMTEIRRIANELIKKGRSEETPVAVVHSATSRHQSVVTGTLESIADAVHSAGLRPPAVIVVGEVVRLREKLSWFETEPVCNSLADSVAGNFEDLFGGTVQ